LEIRHGAIVDNIVTNLYAKFEDDQLWNEKALVDRKSDNNNPKKKNNNKNNVHGRSGPVSGSKKLCKIISLLELRQISANWEIFLAKRWQTG